MARDNEITVIVGRKGAGKTTKCKELVRSIPRKIFIDHLWEYGDAGTVVRSYTDLVEYLRPIKAGRFSVVLQTLNISEQEQVIEMLTQGNPEQPPLPDVTLIVDEADRLCSANWMPDGLSRVVNYGRHFSVSLIAMSRRPRRLTRDITAMADRIVCFRTQEPRDVDYLKEYIGDGLAARVRALPPHECIIWPDDAEGYDDDEPSSKSLQREPFNDASTVSEAALSGNELPNADRGDAGALRAAPHDAPAGAPAGASQDIAEQAP